jgi:hypothetical protein
MRRALALVAVMAPAQAGADRDSWSVTGEAGAELDSNVQRVETGPDLGTTPVTSAVWRFGVRTEGRGIAGGGRYVAALSDLTRVVNDPTVQVENVTLLAGDLRWMHALGERPVSLGVGVVAADALPLSDPIGARTFSNIGADALLAAHAGDERRLLLAVGGRSFSYKPGSHGDGTDHDYDWSGPTASARLDVIPWQAPGGARSLELAFTAGFEARAYDGLAFVNACTPGSPPDPGCSSPIPSIARRDRFQRVGVEATWVGKRLAAIGYQLVVIDSNSFGQSLVRHRATASLTSPLPGDVYGTLLAILQIDKYLDGLVVGDIQLRDFANIENENSSSLQLRLGKKLSSAWSLEGRAAIWRSLGSTAMNIKYERELIYGGIVYSR